MESKRRLSSRRWLVLLVATLALLGLLIVGFNYVMDPYGAFGDPFFHWWGADETMNPRLAKISYLEQHHQDYDSYIVGSSGSSSYPVEALNEYLDARFYNCFFYGTDMENFQRMADYLLDHYEVRHLVLNLSMAVASDKAPQETTRNNLPHYLTDGSNPLGFAATYLFMSPMDSWNKLTNYLSDPLLQQPYRVFDADTGAYDKSRRDTEAIGDLERYLGKPAYAEFLDYPESPRRLTHIPEAMESVAHIKARCEELGVELLVFCQPTYYQALDWYTPEDQTAFRRALAQVTDYWDFTLSSVSYEPRYFYDATHFRNCVGEMALARVFGREDLYLPEDLGEYVPLGSDPGPLTARAAPAESYTARLPILMYHHLTEGAPENPDMITVERFAEQMDALEEAGCTPVTAAQVENYVLRGASLPEKPVLITFDDGYASNYELAWPILQEHQFPAVIFTIGVSLGKDTYKDTGVAMLPHFSLEQAAEMEADGLITVASHGYNIHQVTGRDPEPVRQGALQLAGESERDYAAFLTQDAQAMFSLLGEDAGWLAYPGGNYTELSEVVLRQAGVRVTLTIEPRTNVLIKGMPQSLRLLGRYAATDDLSGQDLLALLEP